MQDIWKELIQWSEKKQSFVIARVTETWRSAPRKPGAAMLIDDQMNIVGSVSGGCIEGAVIEEAQKVLQTGKSVNIEYDIEDAAAWSVGLACGGKVRIFLEKPWSASENPHVLKIWECLKQAVDQKESVALLSRLEEADSTPMLIYENGTLLEAWGDFDDSLKNQIPEALKSQKSQRLKWNQETVFCHIFPAPDRLIIIGAGPISISLIQQASQLNFETYVIDPRKVFANPERFPVQPTKFLTEWPHEILQDWDLNPHTSVVFLTHDPKIDDPALQIVLKKPVGYVGALGSRKNHAKRCQRLKDLGLSEQEVNHIHAPIGLDIGAETPDEIALSIIAEIVQQKRKPKEQARGTSA